METGFHHYALRRPLSDDVVGLWCYGHYAQPHRRERLLPTGTMNLMVSIDAGGHASAIVSGARSSCFLLDTSKPFSVIAASFKAGGGFAFFGRPAGELQNLSVPLDALVGPEAGHLCERLLDARTTLARFRALEQFLFEHLKGHPGRSAGVCYALRAFHKSSRTPRIASVVDEIGWSATRFIATFRHEVGLAPKVYCRVARFRNVVARLHDIDEIDWSDVSLACGYFDQSHFVHDFKEFAGVTPSDSTQGAREREPRSRPIISYNRARRVPSHNLRPMAMRRVSINFDAVREIARALPDVEESRTSRGTSLKVAGRLLACPAMHGSAEPNSLMIAVSLDDRPA